MVSKTIPTTLSTQFHSLKSLQVALAIWGPTNSLDLWGIFGTPSNLIPVSPMKTKTTYIYHNSLTEMHFKIFYVGIFQFSLNYSKYLFLPTNIILLKNI